MLYRLTDDFKDLEPVGFRGFPREKNLENLLAQNLFEKFFEATRLLPFHQERQLQAEADIYALNEHGDVVIFELKRATAGSGALDQVLRYAEDAGKWDYDEISAKFTNYAGPSSSVRDLQVEHKEAFDLKEALPKESFNRNQRMLVVGSAMDEDLMDRVDFWKNKGLSIDFLPFRVYKLGEEHYFEFFAKPYDVHVNPADMKGVLFDTNRSWDGVPGESLKWMVERNRVAAFGSRKDAVRSLCRGDIVFYSHKWVGIVGAAKVVGTRVMPEGEEELYWDVDFLTVKPTEYVNPPAMSFHRVKQVTGRNFFWARILKVPYLNSHEAKHLVEELIRMIGKA